MVTGGASYGAWGGYGYGTETHVSQYEEGTFNIDVVDAKKQQLVWEAVAVGRITDKARAKTSALQLCKACQNSSRSIRLLLLE